MTTKYARISCFAAAMLHTSLVASAQTTFTNPSLKATGMPWSQYEAIGRSHLLECQVYAKNLAARATAPPQTGYQPQGYLAGHLAAQRAGEEREAANTAFHGCMAQKGWIIAPATQ